jgi:hypothetical protein
MIASAGNFDNEYVMYNIHKFPQIHVDGMKIIMSPQGSAGFKNEWRYTSTPHVFKAGICSTIDFTTFSV